MVPRLARPAVCEFPDALWHGSLGQKEVQAALFADFREFLAFRAFTELELTGQNLNVSVAYGIVCSALVQHRKATQDEEPDYPAQFPPGPRFNMDHRNTIKPYPGKCAPVKEGASTLYHSDVCWGSPGTLQNHIGFSRATRSARYTVP